MPLRAFLAAFALMLVPACSDDAPPQATPTASPTTAAPATLPAGVDQVVRFSVDGKDVTGPRGRVKVNKGDTIRLVITSATTDQVHVHTYDNLVPIKAGQTVNVDVKAAIAGVFEVEMETSHVLITKLQVQ